jgi:hypothetical protein
VAIGCARNTGGHHAESGRAHPHVREGIALMCVESRRHQHEIRCELVEHWDNHAIADEHVVAIRAAAFERHVDREAAPVALPGITRRARTRIERVLVRRDEQHPRISIKRPLGAVAVVHVEVDNRHPFHTPIESSHGRNGNAVVQAEAHRAVRLRMVTRRAYEGQRAPGDAAPTRRRRDGNHPLEAGERSAGRERSDLERGRRRIGVGIQHRRAPANPLERIEVRLGVHARELVAAGQTRREHLASAFAPAICYRLEHVGPLQALRVAGRSHVIDEAR